MPILSALPIFATQDGFYLLLLKVEINMVLLSSTTLVMFT